MIVTGSHKAHKETSISDYKGWQYARPIREDINKYFALIYSVLALASVLNAERGVRN